MTLLAGLLVGICVFLVVGCASGHVPRVRLRRRSPRAQVGRRQLWLDQAGIGLSPRQFWATSIGAGAVAFVVVWGVTGTPLVALVPAGGVATLPAAYFSRRRRARLREVQAAWPDGLRDLIASIAAGRPVSLTAIPRARC